ncbi:MAG: helix-turn-helix protein [Bacteroidetes bacterium ADurb.Bin028]|nr:MAG: helix-turn-helix protein [Bacteroidetes bacterium ADurb.Bin028]
MIDKNINKTELHVLTGLSQSTINKLKNGENVNVNVLERICRTLNCQIGDIVELKEEQENGQK